MHSPTILFFINLFFILCVSGFTEGSSATTITIENRCSISVYPAIVHVAGTSVPFTTGFSLQAGESKILTMSDSWRGEVWGRTYCTTDSKGIFTCLTGECASSMIECDGRYSNSPATFTEFNLNTKSNGLDYFGVSVVQGYNLPIMVQPQARGRRGDCLMKSCMIHLNRICPLELKLMRGGDCIACKTSDQPLSKYSKSFKKACPDANVNATDTLHGICVSTNYIITFCPSLDQSRIKKSPTKVENKKVWFVRVAVVVASLLGIAGIGYGGLTIIRNINKIKKCCILSCFNNCCNG